MRNSLFILLIVAAGIASILYAALPNGIGLSQDSICYLSAARSLSESIELLETSGEYFVSWPPFYPLLLAAVETIFGSAFFALLILNIVAYSSFIMTSWRVVNIFIASSLFKYASLIAVIFSFTILQVYATALSESVFLLIINLFVIHLYRFRYEKTADFIWLGVLVALALMLRYAGIFLLLAAVIVFIGKAPRQIFSKKNFLFLMIALLPLVIWLTRNVMVSETVVGFRPAGYLLFWKNMEVLAETITSWIFPTRIPFVFRLAMLLILISLFAKKIFWKRKYLLLTAPVITYLIMLILSYAFFSFEEPRDRILSPIFVPFMLLIFAGLEDILIKPKAAIIS